MTSPSPLRRVIALAVIFGLMVVFGLVGATSIDQGRPVVANLADTANQQIKVRGAALAVETARRLALEGHEAEAAQHERDGNEVDEHVHDAGPLWLCARRALTVTTIDDPDIATAAMSGEA